MQIVLYEATRSSLFCSHVSYSWCSNCDVTREHSTIHDDTVWCRSNFEHLRYGETQREVMRSVTILCGCVLCNYDAARFRACMMRCSRIETAAHYSKRHLNLPFLHSLWQAAFGCRCFHRPYDTICHGHGRATQSHRRSCLVCRSPAR